MDVHEILVPPEVRVDAAGKPYRYVAIAAWKDDLAKQRGDGITRRIGGRDVSAELFNDFRIYYEEVVELIVTRQGAVEREWQRVNGAWVVESAALLIDEATQTAQRKWKRELVQRDMQVEVQGCIDRYLERAKQRGYTGDKRGTTLNLEIAASLDDAQENDDGSTFTATGTNFTNTSSTVASARKNVGLRFANVTIPVGATINSCVLQVNVINTSADDPNVKIYFNDVDNAANFSTEADVTDRVKTTAFVSWVATAIGAGYKSSPDLSVPCQEWVDRAGRVSGNACCVLSEGNSDSIKNFTYDAWDNGANVLHAKLDIDYTAVELITITPSSIASAEVFGTTVLLTDVNIASPAISSNETFGTSVIILTIESIGIASEESVNQPSLELIILSSGIISSEAFGDGTVITDFNIILTSIASSETIGDHAVSESGAPISILPTGLSSEEAFGSATLEFQILLSGIPSGEALGSSTILVNVNILPSSLASGEAFGTPAIELFILSTGISSSESIGDLVLLTNWLIDCSSILTGEGFGSPNIIEETDDIEPPSIPSQESVNQVQLNQGLILTGIISIEEFGVAELNLVIICTGIVSQEASGNHQLNLTVTANTILSLEGFGNATLESNIVCTSIDSWETFGSATILADWLISCQGIVSGEAFGVPNLIVHNTRVLEYILTLIPRYDLELQNISRINYSALLLSKYDTILDVQPVL